MTDEREYVAYGARQWYVEHPEPGETFICPGPVYWRDIFKRLIQAWKLRDDPAVPEPPPPLVLGGWVWTDDRAKYDAWKAQVAWAERYGFTDVMPTAIDIPVEQRHEAMLRFGGPDRLLRSALAVNPPALPFYTGASINDWSRKRRPSPEETDALLEKLVARWTQIAGELADHCQPVALTGRRRRRLLVDADGEYVPSWGQSWNDLSYGPKGWAFSRLRAAVNEALDPHAADHIEFNVRTDWKPTREGAKSP